ncbi:hypothetical protein Sjap_009667 [Stephania japonica]|uniref:Uncharacterized protein n=1 Tax=Stephania japonica TaxID=461633 RepID=A0AAP0J9P6_9MAGN
MAVLGFVVSPTTTMLGWIEYRFVAATLRRDLSTSAELPVPRLPYPRIDGLHVSTYLLFFDALTFYIGDCLVADHLHVRGMPTDQYDKQFNIQWISEDDKFLFHREAPRHLIPSIDLFSSYYGDDYRVIFNTKSHNKNILIRGGTNDPPPIGPLVPLTDFK